MDNVDDVTINNVYIEIIVDNGKMQMFDDGKVYYVDDGKRVL